MSTDYQTLEIICPECNARDWVECEVLIGFGRLPETKQTCRGCAKPLLIEASLDISVSVDAA